MGIPKFFRYISERYPLTSQLIEENKIPEFDNLYLDFNGIIHNCSHPNDGDAHFRLSEEQMFTNIFSYVDHLFGKIKPKKLFFIAVDGVAPRAKMNQQRSRRFRTAKEAQEVRDKAVAKGEKLPDEKAFDSNCITPGTPFMVTLSNQLRYFINKKITEDSDWRQVEVVLSGHEVPGEGEHKIMEYIRLSRSQEDYNPNIRHCLYGLDADLIMLGLLSHDPHFCLLREEVKFGPSRKKGNGSLESINFYLLHLSLMREYLDLEFRDIEPVLPFQYDLERVIDDFILLAVFVGNDFLPNLPDLHIHENGLEKLFEVYKKALPGLGGYINDGGVIETPRLQVVLDEMAEWEREVFEKEYADLSWYKGKQAKYIKPAEQNHSSLVLSPSQRDIFNKVRTFVVENRGISRTQYNSARLPIINTMPAKDRSFLTRLASELHLTLTWDEYDDEDRNLATLRLPGASLEELPESDATSPPDSGSSGEEDYDEESHKAVDRVLSRYIKAPTQAVDGPGDFDARHEQSIRDKMDEWKRNYYQGKLEISFDDKEQMDKLIYRYVEGLQWVMHYYYSGVASWGWFYDYHYAPRISDLRGVDAMSFNFELGTPFRPFEQLMGVLPVASKEHIPLAYQDLMSNPNSPIIDFYPLEFESDLNGKKQDWEAIVKIPFIDEKRLLQAMQTREHRLLPAEAARNTFGTSVKFTYNPGETTLYPSSLPKFFPPLLRCACRMEPFDLPTLDGLRLVQGLRPGVLLGSEALAGFPSLKTLPHVAQIGFHGVNVHGSESRNKSIIVHIENPYENTKTETIAHDMIGRRIFVGWPFLHEAMVSSVSDSLFRYENLVVIPGTPPKLVPTPHSPSGLGQWKTKAEKIEYTYSKRFGVITGPVDVLLHVRPLKGLKRLESGALAKEYEGPEKETEFAVQMSLTEVASEDPRFLEREAPKLADEFPEGSKVFFLGEHAYGVAAQVSSAAESTLAIILAFFPSEKSENNQFKEIVESRKSQHYYMSYQAADMLGISGRALSKITSSFMVLTSDNQKHNIGLNLKFEAKGLKVPSYTKKDGRTWEFSDNAINLVQTYRTKFPEVFRCLDRSGDAIPRAADIFGNDPDTCVKTIKAWLKESGVADLEPVALFSDLLSKDIVSEIEKLADEFNKKRTTDAIKKAIVKGIPRQAVLKPTHAMYRLQHQRFALGDRVTMVKDSGGVPLSAKGVVIGLNNKTMDVIWDVPFMSGTTLGDRCSPYRGSTVEFDSCLNLSSPQFVASTKPQTPVQQQASAAIKSRTGPHPQGGGIGFRPNHSNGPVRIVTNPNRGRGGFSNPRGNGDAHSPHFSRGRGFSDHSFAPRGSPSPVRGRGAPSFERGRGRGSWSLRGRGRGEHSATFSS